MHDLCVACKHCLTSVDPAAKASGARLRWIRESQDLTQEALGRKVSVAQTTIARWEMGRVKVPHPQRKRVAEALNVPPSVIWHGADNEVAA